MKNLLLKFIDPARMNFPSPFVVRYRTTTDVSKPSLLVFILRYLRTNGVSYSCWLNFLLIATLALPCSAHAAKNILVFGDSLSAGYGIAIEKSWVNLLQQELHRTQSGFSIVNASISGETTTGGRQRIVHALKQFRPAIVIVELGANDGLRGVPIKDIEGNLGYIIEQSQSTGAKVLLVGMKLPPNYGEPYITQFANVYPRLANKYRILVLPFLLVGVAADQFQADNLHPVADAQQRIMLNVMQELKHLLH